jgi:hypothetical protein
MRQALAKLEGNQSHAPTGAATGQFAPLSP